MDYYEIIFMIDDMFDIKTHQELILSDSVAHAKEALSDRYPDNRLIIMETRMMFERIN